MAHAISCGLPRCLHDCQLAGRLLAVRPPGAAQLGPRLWRKHSRCAHRPNSAPCVWLSLSAPLCRTVVSPPLLNAPEPSTHNLPSTTASHQHLQAPYPRTLAAHEHCQRRRQGSTASAGTSSCSTMACRPRRTATGPHLQRRKPQMRSSFPRWCAAVSFVVTLTLHRMPTCRITYVRHQRWLGSRAGPMCSRF